MLPTSPLFLCSLLALSGVHAGVLPHFESPAAPSAPVARDYVSNAVSDASPAFNDIASKQRRGSSSKVEVAALESEVTHLQQNFAAFRTQFTASLKEIKAALRAAKDGSGPSKPHYPKLPVAPASGAFNPLATNNIAVYYGQTPLTTSSNLLDLCSNPSITIINLAFVPTFFGPKGYPTTAFGPACNAPQTAAQSSKAPGLQNCAALGEQITQCQAAGKIVLVSLGGYIAESAFPSAASARKFARTLWNLFGPGQGDDPALRPFGPDVVVDGFDIDNEDHSTAYWTDFAAQLRKLYVSRAGLASGKRYYLSSTPQCPRPDASIPLEVMRMSEFVNVQFYNNPACNLDAGIGFLDSVQAWAADLASSEVGTRLFIGAPAWPGAGSGYVAGARLKRLVARAKSRPGVYALIGGISMWDGVEGLANVNPAGRNFVDFAAAALA